MVLQVAVGIETFWQFSGGLKQLGLILRTCKTLNTECRLAFCVASMPSAQSDNKIAKIWARRWLGMRASWLPPSAKTLTLVIALRILEQNGGLRLNCGRGVELRQKNAEDKAKKIQRKLQIIKDRKQFILDVNSRLVGVPHGYFDSQLRARPTPLFISEEDVAKFIARYEAEEAQRQANRDRLCFKKKSRTNVSWFWMQG